MSAQLRDLSFQQIQFLLELSRVGVLLRAGAAFGMSPSKATRTLQKVESELGSPCFTSLHGKFTPTPYFLSIRPTLEQIMELYTQLIPEEFSPADCTKLFRISCVMTEVSHILGGVMPRIMAEAPNVRLNLTKEKNELGSVLDGLTDFAIVTDVNLPLELHRLRLYTVDRVVLLRRGHPLTQLTRPLVMEDLYSYPRVTISTGRTQSWTGPDQDLFPYEKFMQRTRFSTSRFHAAWDAMEKTDLIGICGWRAAEIAMHSCDMTALPLPAEAPGENNWTVLVWSELTHRDPACVWLRKIFADWAKTEEERVVRLMREGKKPPRRRPAP
jgi:DNA-binding transcriptional LysR family regulator